MTLQFDEERQRRKVKDLHKQEGETLAKMLAKRFDIEYIDFTSTPVNSDAMRLVPEGEARGARAVAYNIVDKGLFLAVLSPLLNETKTLVEKLSGRGFKITLATVSEESLKRAWEHYKDLSFATETKAGSLEISNEEIREILTKVRSTIDIRVLVEEVLSKSKGFRISRILEIIIAGALATGASDIHIEPEESYVRLRYRLDGVLNEITVFDRETYHLLLSRVKLISGLKLNIREDAQDGRFSVKLDAFDIEIRTSVLPGSYGESIVLRILNPKNIAVPLEELGIDQKLLRALQKEIEKPEGMILTTGPTGSGKTTTLYAFLKKIHTPDVKIITIEDPIEYHLPGIVQTQVEPDKGYTFVQGLRSALRQDPDILMVGEIRDEETAEIAINSALTGHLVFSTLHTNNAAGTFPRLIDLKVNPKIITSAMNVAMAQRLVRKLCPDCKKEMPIEGATRELFERIMKSITDHSYVVSIEHMWQAVGCEKCNNLGYKGRIGLYEAILTDEVIEKVILQNPSEREIKRAAAPQALLDMRQDGLLKILRGVTSLEELERVVDIEEES